MRKRTGVFFASLVGTAALLWSLGGSASSTPAVSGDARAAARSSGGPAPATADAARAPEMAERKIAIDNFTFEPRSLKVSPGTRVIWVNRDDVPHTATSSAAPPRFSSGALDTDDSFSFTFQERGTYPYFCAIHPHMTGEVIVE